ncbi:helix-turn-helix domain-containing protein [Streptomyces albofaciens]|uniref:helix-turn-helix domain-containing protein n=1 Tax=Streptomyces albofaciens TaxID=66866 RepID=UPI00142EC2E5|nr:helix-turn-helix transcriptional regulator [Streptomyces albofaciens]
MVNLSAFQKRRNELNLTYAQTASRCGRAESTVYRWLTGQSQMSVYDVVALAHALRIPFPDVVENLKNAVEGRAMAAEYRRSEAERSSTLKSASQADARHFVDMRRRAA